MSFSGDKKINVLMILQAVPPQPVGGAEIQALRISKELSKNGIGVLMVAPGIGKEKKSGNWEGIPVMRLHSALNFLLDWMFFVKRKTARPVTKIEFDDASEKTNIITTRVNTGARIRYIIFYLNMLSFLRKNKQHFDIIHTHTIEWPAYVGALLSRKFGKKLVVKDSTMNGITSILRYPSGMKKRGIILEQAHFVAMTRAIESNLLEAGVTAAKISLVPNGIEINEQVPDNSKRNPKSVLFIGNLYQQPAKGVDILLKAWVTVHGKCPGAMLNIIGDGNLEAYNSFTKRLGIANSIRFLGKRQDVAGFFAEAALFVLPSRREGMPNALMEAMLHAVPCIATDISGCQDLITKDINGLLVPPANKEKLADAIVYMLENPDKANAMGAEARKTVSRFFDIRITAKKYADLYQSLLK